MIINLTLPNEISSPYICFNFQLDVTVCKTLLVSGIFVHKNYYNWTSKIRTTPCQLSNYFLNLIHYNNIWEVKIKIYSIKKWTPSFGEPCLLGEVFLHCRTLFKLRSIWVTFFTGLLNVSRRLRPLNYHCINYMGSIFFALLDRTRFEKNWYKTNMSKYIQEKS